MPKMEARKTLLREGSCSSLKNDIKGEKTGLILIIAAERSNAAIVPPKYE